MDIVGPLPTAPTHKKLLLVATNYFSKWIESEAFASIKDKEVVQFVWKNIVCRFGIPQLIVTDNKPQFDSSVYKNFYNELKIKNMYSTPRYPQSNRQTEASNKTLLPGVLWAYRQIAGTNWHITVRPHIWDGSHHPQRNRDAHRTSRNS